MKSDQKWNHLAVPSYGILNYSMALVGFSIFLMTLSLYTSWEMQHVCIYVQLYVARYKVGTAWMTIQR